MKYIWHGTMVLILVSIPLNMASFAPRPALAQEVSYYFEQTNHTVRGVFWQYWNQDGYGRGLTQFGYPLTDEVSEISQVDGRSYTVQYFERAVFEKHDENQAPYNVLLSPLGALRYQEKYPEGAPDQVPSNSPGSVFFAETGKHVGGRFLQHWQANGGVLLQGFPLSDEFVEISEMNGKPYRVQYFERAVFEHHPENIRPFDVLLSTLGSTYHTKRHLSACDSSYLMPVEPSPESFTIGNAGLPENQKADVAPRCGIASTKFGYYGSGFHPNEPVYSWFTAPDGRLVQSESPAISAAGDGTFGIPVHPAPEFAQLPGWWAITWVGSCSQNRAVAWFRIVNDSWECSTN